MAPRVRYDTDMSRTIIGRISILAVIVLMFASGMLLIAAWSVEYALRYNPTLTVVPITPSSEITAKAYMVFDQESGTQVISKQKDEVLPIASVTKLLSASVFYANADLQATTTIVWPDVVTPSTAGRLHLGEVYTYRELLYPLLLESSNDAAAAMARVLPELLPQMQAYADALNLQHTVFADASGLSAQNVSTAHELSILVRDLYDAQPHIFDITRLRQYIGTHTGWMNNDPFVAQEGYAGGKHGFTIAANRTATVFFDETLQNGAVRTVGYVLLGSDDLLADVELLREQVRQHVRYE